MTTKIRSNDGRVLGYVTQEGTRMVQRAADGTFEGSFETEGGRTIFRNAKGAVEGFVDDVGQQRVFRSPSGDVLGYYVREGEQYFLRGRDGTILSRFESADGSTAVPNDLPFLYPSAAPIQQHSISSPARPKQAGCLEGIVGPIVGTIGAVIVGLLVLATVGAVLSRFLGPVIANVLVLGAIAGVIYLWLKARSKK